MMTVSDIHDVVTDLQHAQLMLLAARLGSEPEGKDKLIHDAIDKVANVCIRLLNESRKMIENN